MCDSLRPGQFHVRTIAEPCAKVTDRCFSHMMRGRSLCAGGCDDFVKVMVETELRIKYIPEGESGRREGSHVEWYR